MKNILKSSIINGLVTSLYVILIAAFIYYFGNSSFAPNNSVFIPIAMLLLFVFSAAFTGILVFGKPILWYMEGKKREALSLLFYTLGVFFIITILAFLVMILLTN